MPSLPQRQVSPSIHTVIFVDIDGVLNVGVRDDAGGAPLLLSRANIEQANKVAAKRSPCAQTCVSKILEACQRPIGHNENGTLSILAADGDLQLSDVLVSRLARLIKVAEAKGSTSVVLSSSWRHPKYVKRVQTLERIIERHIGHPFHFNERTEPFATEKVPEDRIRVIGNFLASMPAADGVVLRIVVLDDFFSHPIESGTAMEKSLKLRMPATRDIDVKIVHTFEEWTAPGGLSMQVGVGLTNMHVQDALDFVEKEASAHCGDDNDDISSDSLLSTDSKQDSGVGSEASASTAATSTDSSPAARQRKTEEPKQFKLKSHRVVRDGETRSRNSPASSSPESVISQQELRRLHWIKRVANALPWATGCSFGGF